MATETDIEALRLTDEDCAKIQADVDSGTDNPVTRAVIRALLSDRAALQHDLDDAERELENVNSRNAALQRRVEELQRFLKAEQDDNWTASLCDRLNSLVRENASMFSECKDGPTANALIPEIHGQFNSLKHENLSLQRRCAEMERALHDFAEQGLRCDMNPTHNMSSQKTSEKFWHGYIHRVEESLKGRARAALAAAQPAAEFKGKWTGTGPRDTVFHPANSSDPSASTEGAGR